MRERIAFALAIFFCGQMPALASKDDGDHLEPGFMGEQIFPDYSHAVAERLTGGANHLVLMIVFPSFKSEYAVFISKDSSEKHEVVYSTIVGSLWADMNQALEKGTNGSVSMASGNMKKALSMVTSKVVKKSAPISKEAFEKVDALWMHAVKEIGPPPARDRYALDGVSYFVSDWSEKDGDRGGNFHVAYGGKKMAGLMKVGADLIELASADATKSKEIDAKVESAAASALKLYSKSK